MDRGRTGREAAGRNRAGQHAPGRQSAYDGRFGSSADAGRKRPTGSYRNQPSGSYRSRMGYEAGGQKRPSMRDGGDSYTRRPAPKVPPQRRKRAKAKTSPLMLLLLVLAVLVLAALVAMVISSIGQTYHQMPKVERIASVAMEVL